MPCTLLPPEMLAFKVIAVISMTELCPSPQRSVIQYWFSALPLAHRDFSRFFMIPYAVANDIFKVFPAFCCPIFFRPVAAIKFKMSEYFFQEILKCLSLNIQYVFSVLLWIKYGFVRSPNHSVFVYVTQHSNFLELKSYCFWPRSPRRGVRSEESV